MSAYVIINHTTKELVSQCYMTHWLTAKLEAIKLGGMVTTADWFKRRFGPEQLEKLIYLEAKVTAKGAPRTDRANKAKAESTLGIFGIKPKRSRATGAKRGRPMKRTVTASGMRDRIRREELRKRMSGL